MSALADGDCKGDAAVVLLREVSDVPTVASTVVDPPNRSWSCCNASLTTADSSSCVKLVGKVNVIVD